MFDLFFDLHDLMFLSHKGPTLKTLEAYIHTDVIQLTPLRAFQWPITWSTYYPILTHPVNFPCGRKPEKPEKTHGSFGRVLKNSIPTWDQMLGIEPTTSVVGGCRLDDWATETLSVSAVHQPFYISFYFNIYIYIYKYIYKYIYIYDIYCISLF